MATPVWKLQRQLANAQARQTYYQNYTPPANRTRVPRPTDTYVYFSLFEVRGASQLSFTIQASQKSVAFFTATSLGLSTTTEDFADAISKPDNLKPSVVRAMIGDSSPQTVKPYGGTGYGYTRYYKDATGDNQSHYTAPICKKDSTPFVVDIRTAFSTLSEAKSAELGPNGRMYLQLERLTIPGG